MNENRTLEEHIERIHIDEVDAYHNEEANGGTISGMIGWFYVEDENLGVLAYFQHREAAYHYKWSLALERAFPVVERTTFKGGED